MWRMQRRRLALSTGSMPVAAQAVETAQHPDAAAVTQDSPELCAVQREVTGLYQERAAEFYRYALSLAHDEELAKDALQESFMRYFVARSTGERIESPRAWVYRVLRNYLLDRMREASLHERRVKEMPPAVERFQDLDRLCHANQILCAMKEKLTAREFDCMRLRTEGHQYDEIARACGLTTGSVSTLLSRGLRKIRRALGEREVVG